jgi:glycerate kinase
MKIIVAPDKFKGSLSAIDVCNAIEKGIKTFDQSVEIIKHPLADGGEGTLTILNNFFKLTKRNVIVNNPLFHPCEATYLVSNDTAYIEMATASGLQLLSENERNCFYTSTYGTGELILDAINNGYKNIILFIGGSATNDAGIGMAAALGYEFYDINNQIVEPIGKELININRIEIKNLKIDLNSIKCTVICDVKNEFYGPNGAAYIYASQKGATSSQVNQLNQGLINFSNQVELFLDKKIATIPGTGAAGGLGAGALCFLNAKLQSGIDFVMEHTNFNSIVNSDIDLIITGEGSVDKQTIEGKVVSGVASKASLFNIPFIVVSGIAKDVKQIQNELNPNAMYSIMETGVTQKEAIAEASKYLNDIGFHLIQQFTSNKNN